MAARKAKRTRLFELESAPESCAASKSDPLDDLLSSALGYPRDEGWDAASLRLRPLAPRSHSLDTVQGAVYWVRADGEGAETWAEQQPWFPNLTCRPHKNSLAPGEPKSFRVFYENAAKPGWIGLPRFLGASLFGPAARDIRTRGEDATMELRGDRVLRDYQERARASTLRSLEEWGGATLIADCGAGKTAMALSIAAALGRKTLVLCNRSFLMQQWRHDVEGKVWTWADDNIPLQSERGETPQSWRIRCDSCRARFVVHADADKAAVCACGFRHVLQWTGTIEPREGWLARARVGWLQGAEGIDVSEKDIVIASIESVSQCAYSSEMLKSFGLVIIDEMHHLGALTLSQVLPKLPARYVLGISATPDRVDGLEHVLYWLAGPTAFVYKRLPSVTGLRNTVAVTQRLFTEGARTEIVYKGGKIGFAAMVSALAADDVRNAFLLELARGAAARGRRKLLIVTSIVEHAKYLGAALRCIVIHGGCKPALVAQAKAASTPLVVATYQFLEEGYDDPRIDTLLMALPRSRIQQVVGRCERTHEGKLVPEVLDVVDTFSVFEAMSWKRHHFYKSRGFSIKRA